MQENKQTSKKASKKARQTNNQENNQHANEDENKRAGRQGRAGQGRAGQGRAGQGRAGQGRAGRQAGSLDLRKTKGQPATAPNRGGSCPGGRGRALGAPTRIRKTGRKSGITDTGIPHHPNRRKRAKPRNRRLAEQEDVGVAKACL